MREPYLVRGASDLDDLLRRQRFGCILPQVTLKLPPVGDAEKRTRQAKIDRYQKACSCETGAIFLFNTPFLYLGYIILHDSGISAVTWQDLGIDLAIVTTSAVVGKVIGIAHAQKL